VGWGRDVVRYWWGVMGRSHRVRRSYLNILSPTVPFRQFIAQSLCLSLVVNSVLRDVEVRVAEMRQILANYQAQGFLVLILLRVLVDEFDTYGGRCIIGRLLVRTSVGRAAIASVGESRTSSRRVSMSLVPVDPTSILIFPDHQGEG